jgi:exonuclease SbcC
VVGLKQQREAVVKAIEVQTLTLAQIEAAVAQLTEAVEDARVRRDASRKVADEHKLLAGQLGAIDSRLTQVAGERARRAAELARAQAAGAEAALLAAQVAALPAARERVEGLQARAIQHQELVRLRTELARADADAKAAGAEADAARATLATAAQVRASADAVKAERPTLEAALAAAQAEVVRLETAAREVAKQINDVSGKERKVRAIGPEAPCPSCTRPLREHYDALLFGFASEAEVLRAHLAEHSPQLDGARKAHVAATEALAALAKRELAVRAALEKLAADETRAMGAAAKLADAQARAQRLRAQEAALAGAPFDPRELDAAKLELRAIEAAVAKHARLCAEAERERDLVALLAELDASTAAATNERAAVDARRTALAFDPAAHDALERLAQSTEARLTDARIQRERAAGERVRREEEEKRLAATLAQQEALAARAAEMEKRVLLLEQLAGERDAGLLPEFKDHLIGRIRPLLSLHAGRLFRELTEGRYADLEVDEDYDLLVHDDGAPFALARFSGGEGDLANLCLRLAVSQVVAERAGTEGFGFLALDEIFGSQDEVRKGNILRALASLSGRFRQILLITHIPDVKESAEHVLRVEALDDGTSVVSVDG